MDGSQDSGNGQRLGPADAPLILDNLLCWIEELRATGGDPVVMAEMLAQVELVRGK